MLSVREIFRSSSKISGANILGGVLAAFVNLFVARRLGPESMGILGIVQLWVFYANFARPGLTSAAYREMLHHLGKGEAEEARRIQDIAFTAEGASLTLPLVFMGFAAVFLIPQPELRLGMVFAMLTFLTASVYQYTDSIQWAYQRFDCVTRASYLQRFAQPLLLLAGACAAGVPGALAAAPCATTLTIAYYLFFTDTIRFRPAWDPREAKRLFLIGFPLALNGVLYWGFRTSDRAMVAAWLPLADMGFFTFSMMFITQACQVISDFLNVLQANLFAELGRVGKVRPMSRKLQQIALLILLCAGAGASLAQAFFPPMVVVFAPKFLPAVGLFHVLALNLVSISAPLLAFGILVSKELNRQNACTVAQAGGLLLNVGFGWLLVSHGWGLPGVAWSSVLSQLCVAVVGYALLHPHLFEDAAPGEARRFYASAAGLALLAFAMHFVLGAGPFAPPVSGVGLAPAALRAALGAAVWSCAGALFYTLWRH